MAELHENKIEWVTQRTHLQISDKFVLPVIFKSVAQAARKVKAGVVTPPAFRTTQVELSEVLPALKKWLPTVIDRLFRPAAPNTKPGSLQTPDTLRDGKIALTLSLNPTNATFALCFLPANEGSPTSLAPTPQTLTVVAELKD